MNELLQDVEFKTVNPQDMKFSFREWLWAIFALCCFWNKKFHAPYQGMTYRKAMILMRASDDEPRGDGVPRREHAVAGLLSSLLWQRQR